MPEVRTRKEVETLGSRLLGSGIDVEALTAREGQNLYSIRFLQGRVSSDRNLGGSLIRRSQDVDHEPDLAGSGRISCLRT
jgi:hypothetical protein